MGRMQEFKVLAFGDKFVVDGLIRYLPFFEADEGYLRFPLEFCYGDISWPWEVFKTPNGFHIVGDHLVSAEAKRIWFAAWKREYPKSDYILGNWNFLRPASEAEQEYILKVAPMRPKLLRYYRDKKVFENHGAGQ